MHMKCTLSGPGRAAAFFLACLLLTVARADTDRLLVSASRYEQEYPVINYSGPATQNRVWRLQQKLEKGEVKLQWEAQGGYLRSVLRALDIDPDSQVLVFSRTSLQVDRINGRTPRAIYFNDDTYVAWVQGSSLMEFTVIDANAGTLFFGLENRQAGAPRMEREGGRCLTCHDTYSMMGGGVPRVLAMSSPVVDPADTRTFTSASDVDDRTPVNQRWGGWYVTGVSGRQKHFGNIALREDSSSQHLKGMPHHDIRSLAAYFDTSPYLTDQSDIVALLVFEHQAFVQNMITRVNYKVRSLMARDSELKVQPRTWAQVPQRDQNHVRQVTESLVRAMFFADAAPFEDRIHPGNGYAVRFGAMGPKDRQGRSLRQMDLETRLFRHRLSYLVYSEQFNALPEYVLDYIGLRVADVLEGRDPVLSANIPEAERRAIREILIDTRPRIAGGLSASPASQ